MTHTIERGGEKQGVGALPAEEWRDVAGYEGIYAVSSNGRVKSLPRKCISTRKGKPFEWLVIGGILQGDRDRGGYARVLLARDGKAKRAKVHRLVCAAFHGEPPEGTEVGHLDGHPENNCAANLAWITRQENCLQRVEHDKARQKNG